MSETKERVETSGRWEHPEDRASRLESEETAAKHIDQFIARHGPELKALVQTYADETAHEQLRALRELFWVSLPLEGESK